MPIGGGETSPIRTPAGVAFSSGQPLGPGAVGRDGRILISGTTLDSWFYPVNVIDPDAGTVRRLPLRYDGDVLSLSWNQSGELVTGASLMRSLIWRFRQQPR